VSCFPKKSNRSTAPAYTPIRSAVTARRTTRDAVWVCLFGPFYCFPLLCPCFFFFFIYVFLFLVFSFTAFLWFFCDSKYDKIIIFFIFWNFVQIYYFVLFYKYVLIWNLFQFEFCSNLIFVLIWILFCFKFCSDLNFFLILFFPVLFLFRFKICLVLKKLKFWKFKI
jgi:hypothetical protein